MNLRLVTDQRTYREQTERVLRQPILHAVTFHSD